MEQFAVSGLNSNGVCRKYCFVVAGVAVKNTAGLSKWIKNHNRILNLILKNSQNHLCRLNITKIEHRAFKDRVNHSVKRTKTDQ